MANQEKYSIDQILQAAVKKDATGQLVLQAASASGSITRSNVSKWSHDQVLRSLFKENVDGTFSLVLSGISGGGGSLDSVPINGSTNGVESNGVFDALATRQATLVSGTNIKTVNGLSILGGGDLVVGGGGSSLTTYSAGNGAIVSATGAGVTFARTTSSVWVFAIPAGVRLLSFSIYTASGSNPGAGVDIAFNYTSNSVTNQGVLTAEIPSWSVMQDAGSGFNQITVGSGATSFKPNAFTAASGNLSFTAIQMGNASTGATIIKGNF